MSNSGKESQKDKFAHKTPEVELHNSRVMHEGLLAGEKWNRVIMDMEKNSSAQALRDQLTLIEESPVFRHVRQSALLLENNPILQTFREQSRQFEQNSMLIRGRLGDENSSLLHALKALQSHHELARLALGPVWELRQAGLFDEHALLRKASVATQAITDFEARFSLPNRLESTILAEQFRAQGIAAKLGIFNEGMAASRLQQAMEKMTTPWLDQRETMRSILGFAEIQHMGEAIRTMPAFDDPLTVSLRSSLGDWRDPISWRPEVFTDLSVRGNFYEELGFNAALTAFPLPAFEQELEIAELKQESTKSGSADVEEGGLIRTNAAHNQLQRVERSLRRFIDRKLSEAFGLDWAKNRLPNGVYDSWQEKKRKAEEAGAEERLLIEYSDFTDYELIICRKDNWREFLLCILWQTRERSRNLPAAASCPSGCCPRPVNYPGR